MPFYVHKNVEWARRNFVSRWKRIGEGGEGWEGVGEKEGQAIPYPYPYPPKNTHKLRIFSMGLIY